MHTARHLLTKWMPNGVTNKMKERNERGQFVITTGSTEYKAKQYKGHRSSEHAKNFCIAIGTEKTPEGFIVHHLDGNKKNNDIDNLALITVTAHNRIHAHTSWTKGLLASTNKKFGELIKKAQENRWQTFLPQFKETFELQTSGKTLKEIAVTQGISTRQVCERIKRYKQHIRNERFTKG